jgi:hypothetical protein
MWWAYIRGAYIQGGLIVGGLRYKNGLCDWLIITIKDNAL